MVVKQKGTGRASTLPGGLGAGAAVSMSITAAGTALMAFLLNRETINWEMIGYGIIVMVMLSAFLGSVTAYRKIKRQKLLVCLMSGVVYWGILLCLTALFFGGQYEAVGVTALLIAGGCGCAAICGMEKGRGGKTAKRRKLYC